MIKTMTTGIAIEAAKMNGLRFPMEEVQWSDRFPTTMPAATSTSSAMEVMAPATPEPSPTQFVKNTTK